MNKLLLTFLVVLLSFGCTREGRKIADETLEQSNGLANPASQAVENVEQWWNQRHQTILGRLDSSAQLILVGNSIFHSLDNDDREDVWKKYLDAYQTINMGISGDRTENVIWRLENGSLDNIDPEVALVLIGTNNTDGNHYLNISTPQELAGGIVKICTIIHEKLPDTKIILMGILPYGYKPSHRDNINRATNVLISKFPQEYPYISYVDIGAVYCDDDGNVRPDLMPDYLHPNLEGHMLMFGALENEISRLIVR